MNPYRFRPLHEYRELPETEMSERSAEFLAEMERRRSVRHFSERPVDRRIIERCVAVANSAPSGANRQPWHFVAVGDPEKKREIRAAAEKEEQEFYERRAPDEWLEALEPLGTTQHKPFLEQAPWLIVIFAELWGRSPDGEKVKNYYMSESVGIATGMAITALHRAGLVCLTHTPAPMRFLNQILERPKNEKPYLILVAGYPDDDARIPDIQKKPLAEVLTVVE